MKVVHISHTDAGAGAGRAAYRIHRSLISRGVDSTLIVSQKRTSDETVKRAGGGWPHRLVVKAGEYLEARRGKSLARDSSVFISPSRFSHFSPTSDHRIHVADVVSLFWINGAFVGPEGLIGIARPVVWRLSDVWPFTGGCHYPGDCDHFEQECGSCPQLRCPSGNDASRQLWRRKVAAWRELDITIAAPSQWMASLALRSSLFSDRRVEVIRTGVDLKAFRPLDSRDARARMGIPADKKVIVFGALSPKDDVRKGFNELHAALKVVASGPLADRVLAVVFGSREQLPALPVPAMSLGRLDEDATLAAAYSCADLAVVPSLQDNLPNVALEAIACGVPVAGFDVGGMSDIVRDGWNGVLAPRYDAVALGRAINAVLINESLRAQMGIHARQCAERHFSLDDQALAYLSLYNEIVASNAAGNAGEARTANL